MQLIPEETINEIKNQNDIVDIIGEYVQLKKQGRNYLGLCPFHGEKTPSFSVASDKQIFHCFGCGAGGNVFTFLMEMEGLTFVEATKKLADRVGIHLDVEIPDQGKGKSSFSDMIEAHELLRKLYHHVLVNTTQGQEALSYLHDRGFTDESIEKFQIGYALPSWDYTMRFLEKRGFSPERMEEAGLLIKRERDAGYVDRFRHRIMFPILDRQGKTIAFSGRALGDEEPKYLNSPETAIFNKSRVLYNFQQARPSIRKKDAIVLFEGFADVISADKAGVTNGVATMGTAFTDEHMQILKRTTNHVVLCYDSDSAGIEASNKTADMLQKAGFDVKVALLPDGYDPDEFVKKVGPEKFQSDVIGAAHSFISFKMFYHRRGKKFANEGEKMDYIKKILVEIAKVPSEVEREFYLKQIADEFSLSMEVLKRQEKQLLGQRKRSVGREGRRDFSGEIFVRHQGLKPAYLTAEEHLLFYMLKDREMAFVIQKQIGENGFIDENHQIIVEFLLAYYQDGNKADSSLFLNILPDAKLRKIVTEIEMKTHPSEPTEQEISDYIDKLTRQRCRNLLESKELEQKEAVKMGDQTLATKLAAEIVAIHKSLK